MQVRQAMVSYGQSQLTSAGRGSPVKSTGTRPTLLEKFENPPRPLDESPTTHCKVPGHQLFFVEQIHHIFLQNISNNEDNIAT